MLGVLSFHQGAFWGLVIGLVVGCIRMLLDFIYPAPLCYEEDDRPGVLKYVHYLYFSTILSFLTLLIVIVISLATEKPKPEQVKKPLAFIVMFCFLKISRCGCAQNCNLHFDRWAVLHLLNRNL